MVINLNRRIVYRGDVYDAIEGERISTLYGVLNDKYMDGFHDGLKRALIILANDVKDIPANDVAEVRHGWWMDSKEDGHPSICCVCNYPVDRFFKTKFCPECGAKMTEDHHEQKE